jgi:DNA-directed RNA polymerase
MTVPYNAKPHSNRQYIRDALKEKGVEVETADLTQTVTAVRDAMDRVVPGPMKVMKWIETEVGKLTRAGKAEITWTTPSGFTVSQKLMKANVETVKLQLLGRTKLLVANGVALDADGNPKVDVNKHKNCTAPNLIHSLDASLLHITLESWDAPIAVIHDSVLCRATDMSHLSSVVRETYLELFANHNYLKEFAQQIGATTEPPIIGDLDPTEVIQSNYFFC